MDVATMTDIACFNEDLRYDQGCVNLRNDDVEDAWLYSLLLECIGCPFTRVTKIPKGGNTSLKFDTSRPLKWRVLNADGSVEFISARNQSDILCELSPKTGQFGIYELFVRNQGCYLETIKKPTNPYTALYIILGALLCILLAISATKSLYGFYKKKCLRKVDEGNRAASKRRVNSIDTFRGASILLMMFVNHGAGGYNFLGHATWNGLLVGDLVFPCFAWIMGVCIPIALNSQILRGVRADDLYLTIVKRSIFLFSIGVALNTVAGTIQLERIRIFGVFQRLGVSYLVAASMYLCLTSRSPKKNHNSILREIRDIVILLRQWIVIGIFLAVHSYLTFRLAVPGCPTGYLGPGGLHEDRKYLNCVGGATGYLDRLVLGENHMLRWSTANLIYKSGPFDPEGILGCLTTIFQVFLGVQAGQILLTYKNWKDRVVRWLLWATILGGVGCGLHFSAVIPVNKNLWSISFVLVTTSFALALLSAFYLLVDVVRVWNGGPFRIPGMNALTMYVGHIICYKMFPFHWKIGKMSTHGWITAEAVWAMIVWVIIAYIMHRKKTYITL